MSADARLHAVQLLLQVLPGPLGKDGSMSDSTSGVRRNSTRRRGHAPKVAQHTGATHGKSLREVLRQRDTRLSDAERGLVTDLCFGVCRHYRLLDHWLGGQLQKPLKQSAQGVRLALLCGIHELWFSERPAHAVVNAWPDVCRALKAPWAAGLCNAILRKASRIDRRMGDSLPGPIRHSLPDWLWHRLQQDWPAQAEHIALAGQGAPPMTLRCNIGHADRDALRVRLADVGIAAQPGTLSPLSLYLDRPVPVNKLPGFSEGIFSVQDESAQLPALLIEVPEQGRILDACAAPGGKTGQLAERFPDAHIVALDNQAERLQRIEENLERLRLRATLVCGDATEPSGWWDGEQFDAILLDAPCSATGILRRQPDGKWHRRDGDIAELAGLQCRMLSALWPLVRPGGMLVYATCSILREENEKVIQGFLQQHDDATEGTPTVDGNVAATGVQLLPEEGRQDGFYFARVLKDSVARHGGS